MAFPQASSTEGRSPIAAPRCWEPDGIEGVPLLQVLMDPWLSEDGIGPEVPAHSRPLLAGQDGIQHLPPIVRAITVPGTEHGPLAVTKLVEGKDRMIAHAAKVAVVGRLLLFPMNGTL